MQAPSVQQENSAPQAASSSNPFMQAPGQGESDQGSSTFMDGISAFNRQFERLALGSMQLMSNYLPESVNQSVERVRKLGYGGLVVGQNEADLAAQRSPIASGVGTVAGAVGAGTAYGAIGAGIGGAVFPEAASAISTYKAAHPIIASVAQGAAGGSTLGVLDEADSGEQRLKKAAIGGLAGGAIGAAIPAVKGAANYVDRNLLRPGKAALENAANTIGSEVGSNIGAVKQATQSADQVGTQVSMGEAFPESIGPSERIINPSKQVKDELIRPAYNQRVRDTKQAISNTIEQMAPKDADNQTKQLFGELGTQFVSPTGEITKNAPAESSNILKDLINQLPSGSEKNKLLESLNAEGISLSSGVPDIIKNNSILVDKYKDMLAAKSEKFKSIPRNSIAFYDQIRKSIDDDLYTSSVNKRLSPEKSLKPDQEAALQEARVQLKEVLNQSPEYQKAMEIGRQKKIQATYNELINSKSFKSGRGNDIGLDEIRSQLFSTKEKQNKFIDDVITTGGNPEQAKAVIDLTDKLSKSPLQRILNVSTEGDAGNTRQYGKSVSDIVGTVQQKLNANYYKAVLNLTLDPKWSDKITEVLSKRTQKSKLTGYADLLKSIVTTGTVGATSSGFGNQLVGE